MVSSRIILVILSLFLLLIVVLSSSRVIETLRKKIGILPQQAKISTSQTAITPTATLTPGATNDETRAVNTTLNATEIPGTGPNYLTYILLGSGIISGVIIRKFQD